MILTFDDIVGATAGGRAPVFVAHGILGSRRNWRLFARTLVERRPDLRLVLVDLRGHGDSQPCTPPHTVDACARDLAALVEVVGVPKAIIGHSFGARVALCCARDHLLVDRVLVLDSPPGGRIAGQEGAPVTDVERLVSVLAEIPMPVPERAVVLDVLAARGYEPRLLGWMATNLRRMDGRFHWRFNLDVVQILLADFFAHDLWPLFEDAARGFAIHLLRAGQGDHWQADDVARLDLLHRRGIIEHTTLARAGHWLHADDPDGVASWLTERL